MAKVGTYQVQTTLTLAARWLEIHDFFAKRWRCKWQDGQLSVILRPSELISIDPLEPPESSPWTEIIIQPAIKRGLLQLSMTLRMHTDRRGQVYDDRAAFQEIVQMLKLAFPAPEKPAAGRKLGTHGSTLDRVREARDYIEHGIPKTQACRRAGIDTRTYDRYADQVINWGKDEEDWDDEDEN